jgi:hypothetical protein
MRWTYLALALLIVETASSQDVQLSALHQTLSKLAAKPQAETFDAPGPELTVAKHQLRDWIEAQLDSVQDPTALSDRINAMLKTVEVENASDDQNFLGSLGDVDIRDQSGMLVVTTSVGIPCQYDESVYGYKRVDNRWRRVLESEQLDYSPGKCAPQLIFAIHVWQAFKDGHETGPAYVLTLGNEWGGASAWHQVYHRVWRVDPSASKLLIDGSEFAWLRTGTYAVGSMGQDRTNDKAPIDVLIEFTQASIDGGVHNREAIRHYLIDGDRVQRVDPVALRAHAKITAQQKSR